MRSTDIFCFEFGLDPDLNVSMVPDKGKPNGHKNGKNSLSYVYEELQNVVDFRSQKLGLHLDLGVFALNTDPQH